MINGFDRFKSNIGQTALGGTEEAKYKNDMAFANAAGRASSYLAQSKFGVESIGAEAAALADSTRSAGMWGGISRGVGGILDGGMSAYQKSQASKTRNDQPTQRYNSYDATPYINMGGAPYSGAYNPAGIDWGDQNYNWGFSRDW